MKYETDYSLLARTNPVFLTAKTAVCLMAEAGIPYSAEIVRKLGLEGKGVIPGMSDPDMILGNAIVVEAKFRTMCLLIEETGCPVNVDLPCGYTPKALHMSEKGIRFIGLDLPIVAREVEPIIKTLSDRPDGIRFCGVDATNYESLEAALRDVEGPVCISTEGMMMYFTESEVSAVVSNVRRLLESHGGCWITPDPEFILQFFLTFQSVLGEDAMRRLIASRDAAEGQSDVASLINSLILKPADVPGSEKTALAFLEKHGLTAEKICLAEKMPELSIYRKLSEKQREAFRKAMGRCHYWVIRPQKEQNRTVSGMDRPFGLDYILDDTVFRVSLRGRMDTLTAPELLKAWETEKNAHPVSAVEVDCGALDYISSAGLRVLLIMQKNCGHGVTLKRVHDNIREILEQTGFDALLTAVHPQSDH